MACQLDCWGLSASDGIVSPIYLFMSIYEDYRYAMQNKTTILNLILAEAVRKRMVKWAIFWGSLGGCRWCFVYFVCVWCRGYVSYCVPYVLYIRIPRLTIVALWLCNTPASGCLSIPQSAGFFSVHTRRSRVALGPSVRWILTLEVVDCGDRADL